MVATTVEPYYATSLSAVPCPAGTEGLVPGDAGRGSQSSCEVLPGYSGAVVATTTDNYFVSNVAAVECPRGSFGFAPGAAG